MKNGRNGKKRLSVWLPEDHPIFKVPQGERTRAIQGLGNLEIAMAHIVDMRNEMKSALSSIAESVGNIEKTVKSGLLKVTGANETGDPRQAGEYDLSELYRDFGGLAVAQGSDQHGASGMATRLEVKR